MNNGNNLDIDCFKGLGIQIERSNRDLLLKDAVEEVWALKFQGLGSD